MSKPMQCRQVTAAGGWMAFKTAILSMLQPAATDVLKITERNGNLKCGALTAALAAFP